MARVLLGFAGALAAPEALFSLLGAGHEVRFFGPEGARAPALALPFQRPPLMIPPPEAGAEAAVAALRAGQTADPADAALPLDDISLWLLNAAFGPDAAPLPGGAPLPALACATGARAAAALDKTVQVEAARAGGFALPPTWITRDAGELAAALEEVPLPAIVKPALAARVAEGRLARDGAAFLAARGGLDPAALPLPALVQPLVRGTGEGVFGFAHAGGVAAWSGHRRLRMMNPHGSGASASRARAPSPDEIAAAGRMVAALGWRGPFMVELLRPENGGPPLFMELNGRLWGSTALARRGGHEHASWAVAQALDPSFVPDAPPIPEGLEVRHLGRELRHVLFVARGPKTPFHRAGWPRRWPALRAVLPAALAAMLRPGPGFHDFDPRAPRFFLSSGLGDLRHALFGALRR